MLAGACSYGLHNEPCSALGDALAVALSEKRGFKEEDFANLHPGGKLGKRLARVESLMHSGDAVPRVTAQPKMPDVIYEMSRKKLGMTAVVEGRPTAGCDQRRRSAGGCWSSAARMRST